MRSSCRGRRSLRHTHTHSTNASSGAAGRRRTKTLTGSHRGMAAGRTQSGIFLATMPQQSPMRIRLDAERRARLLDAIKEYFAEAFEDDLSDFRAHGLLDFFVRELGPPIYNQGVRDAASFVQSKLADIEGEIYERD